MKRTHSSTPVTIGLCALFVLGASSVLRGEGPCSYRSVEGDFGYTVVGARLPLGPADSVGWVHFDRQGNITGTQTLSINGTIVQGEILTGTFVLNSDCTGSSTIVVSNTPFPRTSTLDVVWVDDSNEFLGIFTNDGTILVVDGKRIRNGH